MRNPRVVLFLTIFVAMLGLSVLFPVLAPLGRALGLSATQVGAFSTVYSLLQFICAPLWGARSEQVGRKPVLVLGLVGFSISFGLFGLFASLGLRGLLSGGALFALLILARAVGGAISSATLPTAQASMADLSGKQDRAAAMGLIGAAFGLGVVFGPALGAALSTLGLLAPVYFSAGLGLFTALFARLVLRESRQVGETAAPGGRGWDLLRLPGLPLLLLLSALYTLASVGMEQTIGFYVQDRLHVSGAQAVRTIGEMLAVFGFLAAGVQGARPLFKRFAPAQLISVGLAVMGAGMFLIPHTATFWSITAALGLVGVGSALLGPSLSATLSLKAGSGEQGKVAGLNSSALALGRMLGPLIGTALYQRVSVAGPYTFSGALLLALLGVAVFAFRGGTGAVAAGD